MHPTIFNVNKSLPLEKTIFRNTPFGDIPTEYQQLVLPHASILFRQDGICDILSQNLHLGPFSVWMHDILSKENFLIRSYTPIPIYTVQFMFEDSVPLPKAGYLLEDRECSGFYISPGELHRIPMEAGKKIFSFHINIQPLYMAALVTQYPQLEHLMHGIHPRSSVRINNHPYHINAVCDMLIRKIITSRYSEEYARPFLQRCITDILLNFTAQHMTSQEPFLFSTMLNTDTYHNLFTFIAEHPHKFSSPAELAYMYEIPLQEMEHGFQQHFAMSISNYIHMIRMMMTWHICQGRSIPLKDIAKVAGYDDTDAMLSELKDYYGMIPH